MNDQKDIKGLKYHFIKRFLLVIVFISLMELFVITLINRLMIPFAVRVFFNGADIKTVGITGIIVVVVVTFFNLIFGLIRLILPEQVSSLFNTLINVTSGMVDKTFFLSDRSISITDMTMRKELLFFIYFLSLFALIALPYVLGAFFYSHLVVTELSKIEESERLRQKEYEKKRNLMLSDIAHDLRTPITTVSGYAKALSDGMVEEERRQEYLDAIQVKSKRMNDLITLLFDYVKLDSEGFTLTKERLDICELTRECGAFIYQDMEDAGMEPDIEIPEERIMINADKLQMTRVINNLLTNAIRHNKEGSSIGLFVYSDVDFIRVIVADNGDVIPDEDAAHIFEPFVMGDESRNSKGGSGLGLSIAKKILDMHGFKIKLVQGEKVAGYKYTSEYSKAFVIMIPAS